MTDETGALTRHSDDFDYTDADAQPHFMDEDAAEDGVRKHGDEGEVAGTTSFMSRLWHALTGSSQPQVVEQRLWDLTQAIEAYPEVPSNYVLRGELYLELGEVELAAVDFRKALDLSEDQMERNSWGVVAQAMQDRAQTGLQNANRRIKH